MQRISKGVLLSFVVTTLSGACLHFVYDLFPNPLFALFSPVNESLWEHIKILFWPGLAAVLCRRDKADADWFASRLLALLLSGVVMLGVGYFYHIVLRGGSLHFDIGLYVAAMALFFLLPILFEGHISKRVRDAVYLLTAAAGIAILLFTFLPPGFLLFSDPCAAYSWLKPPLLTPART